MVPLVFGVSSTGEWNFRQKFKVTVGGEECVGGRVKNVHHLGFNPTALLASHGHFEFLPEIPFARRTHPNTRGTIQVPTPSTKCFRSSLWC